MPSAIRSRGRCTSGCRRSTTRQAFADRRFPVLFDLVGFMGSGASHTDWKAFSENVPERAARLIHQKKMEPAIVVFPDCFTSLGGNQYINSSAVGRYADYLTQELVPFVDARVPHARLARAPRLLRQELGRLRRDRPRHAVSEVLGRDRRPLGRRLLRFRLRRRLAEHARRAREVRIAQAQGRADRRAALASAAKGLAEGLDDGRVARFLADLRGKKKLGKDDGHTVMNLCMAATYDPDPKAPNGFRLPYHLETGERIEKRWKRWLAHDPIHLVKRHAKALKSLRGIYVDCGWADQFRIHYGTRLLSLRLAELGIGPRYEEFDDNHSDIDYRMDVEPAVPPEGARRARGPSRRGVSPPPCRRRSSAARA